MYLKKNHIFYIKVYERQIPRTRVIILCIFQNTVRLAQDPFYAHSGTANLVRSCPSGCRDNPGRRRPVGRPWSPGLGRSIRDVVSSYRWAEACLAVHHEEPSQMEAEGGCGNVPRRRRLPRHDE